MQSALPLRKNLDHIYWIGGAPCAGKTSIARLLAKQFGLAYIKVDDYVGELEQMARAKVQPISYKMKATGEPKRKVLLISLTALEELVRLEELFAYAIDQIIELPNKPMIVEGCALLPSLLDEYLSDAKRAIWLAPTPEFQEGVYPHRGKWVQDILHMTPDSLHSLKHWMMRERALAGHIINDAKERAFQYHIVDGSLSISCTADLIARRFGLIAPEEEATVAQGSFLNSTRVYTPAVLGY